MRYDGLGIPSLFGMAAGLVDIVPTSTSWIGVQRADNLAAEFTAFAHASVLALGVNFDTSVVIAPDLELSLLLAQDSCTCKAHPLLVALLHCLGHSLHHQGHGVHPVRAHCGHPWNELADTLAKFALQCGTPIGRIHAPVLHEMMLHRDVMWTWVTQQHDAFANCLPPSPEPGLWHLTSPATKPAPPISSVHKTVPSKVCFVAVTANVLALDSAEPEQQALHSSRAARLDLQWHQQHVAVIGIQESRRSAGRSSLDHYITFASGVELSGFCPHHGCELWLHKSCPWGYVEGHGPLAFGDMQASVALADPRRLVVNLVLNDLQVSFVVLHAPCRSASPEGSLEAIQSWWTQTVKLLRRVGLAAHVWVFADLNADVGTCEVDQFSTFGHFGSSPQSEIVEDALQQLDWFAPSTFSWCHQGPHSTWTHPRGTAHRLDFPLCSRAAFSLVHSTWVDVPHDSGFAHADQYISICRVG